MASIILILFFCEVGGWVGRGVWATMMDLACDASQTVASTVGRSGHAQPLNQSGATCTLRSRSMRVVLASSRIIRPLSSFSPPEPIALPRSRFQRNTLSHRERKPRHVALPPTGPYWYWPACSAGICSSVGRNGRVFLSYLDQSRTGRFVGTPRRPRTRCEVLGGGRTSGMLQSSSGRRGGFYTRTPHRCDRCVDRLLFVLNFGMCDDSARRVLHVPLSRKGALVCGLP